MKLTGKRLGEIIAEGLTGIYSLRPRAFEYPDADMVRRLDRMKKRIEEELKMKHCPKCDKDLAPMGARLWCSLCGKLFEEDGTPVDMKTIKMNCGIPGCEAA